MMLDSNLWRPVVNTDMNFLCHGDTACVIPNVLKALTLRIVVYYATSLCSQICTSVSEKPALKVEPAR